MGRYRQAVLIAAALVALAGRPAFAQPELEEARKRFEQGESYFKAGTYDKAIEEYRAAYALVPRPGLLFNIALCYEKDGDAARAIEYYDRYLGADPGGAKSPEARARREALARELAARQAEGERAARAASERAAGAVALESKDYDEAVARLKASYELVPEPEVVFELAEAYRGKGNDILAETEYRRYLIASETGPNRERASERLRELDARRRARSAVGPDPSPRSGTRGSLTLAVIAYSAAGVAAGAGIIFGLESLSITNDIDDELETGTPPLDSSDPRFEDQRRAALAANVSFAIAGAAVIAGAVLTWRALRSERRPAALVAPVAGPDGAGARLEVTW